MKKQRILTTGFLGFLLTIVSLLPLSANVSAGTFPGVNGRIMFTDITGPAYHLSSVKPDGTDYKDVLSGGSSKLDVEYSADGTKIVYAQIVGSDQHIFKANADGSNPQQLTTGSKITYTPSWSPDGSTILYSQAVSSQVHIFRMNADGSNQTEVTSTGVYYHPEYSPDGTKIIALFDSTDDEIYKMNPDGTDVVNLTNNSVEEREANWSPDGTKIIYASEASGDREIFTMNADGTNKTQITFDAVGYHSPAYSPDGTKIAFIDTLAPSLIYVGNADGTNLVSLPVGWARELSWQPLTIKPSSSTPNVTTGVVGGKATVNVSSLYTDSYGGIDNATVAVTSTPTSGTTSVDTTTGVITYTPQTVSRASFWSNLGSIFFPKVNAAPTDSFTYQVCSVASSSLCSSGTITVSLLSAPATGAGQPTNTNFLGLALVTTSLTAIGLGIRKLRIH